MKRSLESKLVKWKNSTQRKPLIINGARQVGKTYLLENFGKKYFNNTIIVDFKEDLLVHNIFKEGLNTKQIVSELSIYLGVDIKIDEDFIFFDEIQQCPEALSSLKYFYKNHPSSYICGAGSLLGLGLSSGDFPVGKIQTFNLYPMTFDEFLIGIGEEKLASHLKTDPFTEAIHQKTWKLLKIFFITGGLPEVVVT